MSPSYYNRKRDKQLEKSLKGVAARQAKRLAANPVEWRRVFALLVVGHASPDGRTLALQAHGCADWHKCGSERAVRGALAKMMFRKVNQTKGRVE